jgi:organic hydroperoxide reductase OsmC/OhrA
MKGEPVIYAYKTQLTWEGERKGMLTSEGKPALMVACPPEFGGHENIWSPEDLFLSSVEVCTMTTFLWLAQKQRIQLNSYQSKATGTAELVDKTFRFSSIHIQLSIGVSSESDRKKVIKIIEKIPTLCLVSNSIRSVVAIESDIFLCKSIRRRYIRKL